MIVLTLMKVEDVTRIVVPLAILSPKNERGPSQGALHPFRSGGGDMPGCHIKGERREGIWPHIAFQAASQTPCFSLGMSC